MRDRAIDSAYRVRLGRSGAHGRTACAMSAALGSLMLASCASGPAPGAPIKSEGPPILWGYVLRADKGDTVPAARAKVWTDPPSNAVVTDSLGKWSIDEGLVPGQYRVLAEIDGVSGGTQRVAAKLGTELKVIVLIGAEETAWPPSVVFDVFLPKQPKSGKGPVRCCE